MSSKAFGDGRKLSNIHYLVDKTMNMCENHLPKTYSKISRASSCRCIGIVRCLHYNRKRALPGFQKTLQLFGEVRWEVDIRELCLVYCNRPVPKELPPSKLSFYAWCVCGLLQNSLLHPYCWIVLGPILLAHSMCFVCFNQ